MTNIKEKFSFVSKTGDETASFRLTDSCGKYHGVVYNYGEVKIGAEDEQGNLNFKFEYNILDNAGVEKKEFNDEFFRLIGDILVYIIDTETFETGKRNDADD